MKIFFILNTIYTYLIMSEISTCWNSVTCRTWWNLSNPEGKPGTVMYMIKQINGTLNWLGTTSQPPKAFQQTITSEKMDGWTAGSRQLWALSRSHGKEAIIPRNSTILSNNNINSLTKNIFLIPNCSKQTHTRAHIDSKIFIPTYISEFGVIYRYIFISAYNSEQFEV